MINTIETVTSKMRELIKAHGQLAVKKISLCEAAKYIYGKMYPELCKQNPGLIWDIAGLSNGNDNARTTFISL